MHDVTVRRKAETHLLEKHEQLDHLAHDDQLTGLANRLLLGAPPGAIEVAKKTAPCSRTVPRPRPFEHVNDSPAMRPATSC